MTAGLLALALVAALATACAKPDSGFKPDQHETTFVTTVPQAEAAKMQTDVELLCDLPGNLCPSAVALMLTRIDTSANGLRSNFYQCTSFLVAPNVMATNSHCLPPSIRQAGASCSQVQFSFGRNESFAAETANCESVLAASEIEDVALGGLTSLKQADYAFLKLRSSLSRPPLQFSRSGFQNQKNYHVLAIDPVRSNGRIRGRLKSKTCRATTESYLSPSLAGAQAEVISAQCDIIHGNSGSPVLDDQALVHGLLHGSWQTSTLDIKKTSGFLFKDHFDPMSVITNVSCIQMLEGVLGTPRAASCDAPAVNAVEVAKELTRTTKTDFQAQFDKWLLRAPKMFEYSLEIKTLASGQIGYPQVKCAYPLTSWSAIPAGDIGVSSSSSGNNRKTTVTYPSPIWGARVLVDSDFQMSASPGLLDKGTATLTFDPVPLASKHMTRVEMGPLDGSFVHFGGGKFDLPVCPD